MDIPLHSTIASKLRSLILSSVYRTGSRLPSEPTLAKSLGVSRTTLREAMKVLESEGMIQKKRGSGTYVRALTPSLGLSISIPASVTKLIESLGSMPGTREMKICTEKVFPDDIERLKLTPDASVIKIERVRTANSQPVAYTIEIIPAWVMKQVPTATEDNFSLIRHFETKCGIKLTSSYGKMIPLQGFTSVATKLEAITDSHIFLFEGVTYSSDGHPVIYSREYFTPWLFRMNVERHP